MTCKCRGGPLLPARLKGDTVLFKLDGVAVGSNDDLPVPPAIGFIGRDAVLLDLDRAFDEHRIVLLHAYAGSGKTTTAIEFSRWYRDTKGIEGPIWFDSFQEYRPLERVLDRIEQEFGRELRQSGINWLSLDTSRKKNIALQALAQTPVLWIWDKLRKSPVFRQVHPRSGRQKNSGIWPTFLCVSTEPMRGCC